MKTFYVLGQRGSRKRSYVRDLIYYKQRPRQIDKKIILPISPQDGQKVARSGNLYRRCHYDKDSNCTAEEHSNPVEMQLP